jgi:hypothetical protein
MTPREKHMTTPHCKKLRKRGEQPPKIKDSQAAVAGTPRAPPPAKFCPEKWNIRERPDKDHETRRIDWALQCENAIKPARCTGAAERR